MDIIQNDYGFDMNFTVLDSDSTPINLSGGSVQFTVADKFTLGSLFTKNCTIDTAASGLCHYTVGSGDFSAVGNYTWQLSAVWTDKIQSYRADEPIVVVRKL